MANKVDNITKLESYLKKYPSTWTWFKAELLHNCELFVRATMETDKEIYCNRIMGLYGIVFYFIEKGIFVDIDFIKCYRYDHRLLSRKHSLKLNAVDFKESLLRNEENNILKNILIDCLSNMDIIVDIIENRTKDNAYLSELLNIIDDNIWEKIPSNSFIDGSEFQNIKRTKICNPDNVKTIFNYMISFKSIHLMDFLPFSLLIAYIFRRRDMYFEIQNFVLSNLDLIFKQIEKIQSSLFTLGLNIEIYQVGPQNSYQYEYSDLFEEDEVLITSSTSTLYMKFVDNQKNHLFGFEFTRDTTSGIHIIFESSNEPVNNLSENLHCAFVNSMNDGRRVLI